MDTDSAWEEWGRSDPYFGVLTNEKFRNRNLTADAKAEFFASGEAHVQHVLDVCRRHFDPVFTPRRVLDFGCGTGRLVIPFARIAAEVVGLDVSDAMLAEARRNCESRGLANVRLQKSADDLASVGGSFDLVHSFIVFQHIPVTRGMQILEQLLSRLRSGGLAAVHLTYSKASFRASGGISPQVTSPITTGLQEAGRRLERGLRRVVRRRLSLKPEMQMNPYNANAILFRIQDLGVREAFVEFTDHDGDLGTMLYFRRPGAA